MSRSRLWWMTLALAGGFVVATPGAQTPAEGQSAALPYQTGTALIGGNRPAQRVFTGAPIDVDYNRADLREVLRDITEFGGLNLAIDPSVPADQKVTVTLKRVPWDQALETVLRLGQLGYELNGNIVTIMSADAMQKEYDNRIKLAQSRADTEAQASVKPRVFALNYARGIELEKVVRSLALSKWGTITFDERTNTLVVNDVPAQLDQAALLIARLDQPELQVQIDAKIVQTNRDQAKALGIEWGFNGRMSPELGNTSNLAFPNNGSVGGRLGTQGPVDPRANELSTTGKGVNLPVTGATSGVGLALGSINGAFNLDVQLTALEKKGKVHIVSSPSVTTQNNKEAVMSQGFQIPFQTTMNNTTTIQFKDAALKLTVTPHITGAGTVIMDVLIENGVPDFSRAVNGNPSINTQRADTKVQVPDGVTTVIGGIKSTTESSSTNSTPGASRIPILNWLFKSTDNKSDSQELMIFITPRIVK